MITIIHRQVYALYLLTEPVTQPFSQTPLRFLNNVYPLVFAPFYRCGY